MAENGKEHLDAAIEKARDLFNQGKKELQRASEMAKDKGEDAWERVQERSEELLKTVRAAGLDRLDSVRENSEELVHDVQRMIKKYPSRAIGFSVLAGIFLGILLSRDRD
jgi:ElaB/YqjD/DUF883 family membrane-anchored ribosome-binding protein